MKSNKSVPASIDEYLASFPAEVQTILQQIRSTIRENAPGATETINYQIPTFQLNGNLVHFAAFKNHIGFYPAPSAITKFSDELKGYKQAKGSVQFPLDRELPLELIARMVQFRVAEQLAKSAGKRK